MAGRRRAMSRAGSFVALGALLAAMSACGGGDGAPSDARSTAVQHVLDRRAAAVVAGDTAAYRATGDADPALLSDLAEVPLDGWSYRLTRLGRTEHARATATAELRYRVEGYDKAPVVTERTLTLRLRTGHWYVTDDRPAKKSADQLWDQGRVTVVKGEHSLVLGVGQRRSALRSYADDADDAVPAVDSAWGTDWARRVVVVVPKSLDGMGELLGAPASGYQGIAAVTTGEAGGSRTAPADRVIINPEAYSVLGYFGKQVVLTHETTHVATRAHTSAATPLWLSEGYADWAGYRGSGRTPAQAAPELQRAVRGGSAPGTLPDDADFGFSGDSADLAQAYESGWLACRMIADDWGEEKLNAFYKAVGGHRQRAGAVDAAAQSVLGVDERELVARWRSYVRDELG
ncbi:MULTISPECIES: hypothetical protein [unclassified Streptomyces]|uniref:hypothetical protein n=1 Tax=unclassified Streptomyces TaxID=2593676 RepID=UPI000DB97D52|nr:MULTISPECIES: hypothetical protein [unclassified Streptomyces]MYT70606.1 hypothetical protein [Streptomyces sp. SID8367]